MNIKNNDKNVVYINMSKYILCCSYETIIAYYDRQTDKIYKSDYFYSKTTSKHFNRFLDYYNFSKNQVVKVDRQEFENFVNNL